MTKAEQKAFAEKVFNYLASDDSLYGYQLFIDTTYEYILSTVHPRSIDLDSEERERRVNSVIHRLQVFELFATFDPYEDGKQQERNKAWAIVEASEQYKALAPFFQGRMAAAMGQTDLEIQQL
jgi:hypothetical protein